MILGMALILLSLYFWLVVFLRDSPSTTFGDGLSGALSPLPWRRLISIGINHGSNGEDS